MKTIPFTEAHTYIAHIWQYPLPPPPRGIDRRICLTRAVRAQLAENEAAARAVKTNKETEGSLLTHRCLETFR